MYTSSSRDELNSQLAEVRWPVTLLTPHGPIDGRTEYIGFSRIHVVSQTFLPMEGDFGVLIKTPNHQPVHLTSEVVRTTVNDSDDGGTRFGVELQSTCISRADRDFVCRIIANHGQNKTVRPAQREEITSEGQAAVNTGLNHERKNSDVRMPVSYNKGGKRVKANATAFSTKGCLVLTKKPHRTGTVFSLQIKNAKSNKSTQVDGSVYFSKHFAASKCWGMSIRFINLSERGWDELRQVLANPRQAPKTSIKSKYLDTWKGFVFNMLSKSVGTGIQPGRKS